MSDPIFRRIAAPSTLAAAWQRVQRNAGGAGIDGIGIAAFAAPLLSNIYLDPVDRLIDGRKSRLVRYADNIALLATDRAAAARADARIARLLADRGLALNPDKTRLVRLDRSFVFLGYRIGAAVHVADDATCKPAAVAPSGEACPTDSLLPAHGGLQRSNKARLASRRPPA